MNKQIFSTALKGIAVAMGVAVIVTNIVSPLSLVGLTNLLALGVTVLGLAALQK
jgi:hypothetical protein